MDTNRNVLVNQPLTPAIGRAWKAIRDLYPEVPPVRLAIGSRHRPHHALAHFLASADPDTPHELLISWAVESTASGVKAMGIIVHEATHAIAHARGVSDTARKGRYHNASFARLAAEMGLFLSPDRPDELGADTLTIHAEKTYAAAIKALDAAFEKVRGR